MVGIVYAVNSFLWMNTMSIIKVEKDLNLVPSIVTLIRILHHVNSTENRVETT